jgi:hypothetical protein
LDKWIHEFTFDTLQQLHDLLGDVIGVQDNKDAIASLDRLESLLQQNGLLSAHVKRDNEELRVDLQQ